MKKKAVHPSRSPHPILNSDPDRKGELDSFGGWGRDLIGYVACFLGARRWDMEILYLGDIGASWSRVKGWHQSRKGLLEDVILFNVSPTRYLILVLSTQITTLTNLKSCLLISKTMKETTYPIAYWFL